MKKAPFKRWRVMSDGQLYRPNRVFKMLQKFKDMNWIEQQSFLQAILSNKYLKQRPSKEHIYHHFIAARGKPKVKKNE